MKRTQKIQAGGENAGVLQTQRPPEIQEEHSCSSTDYRQSFGTMSLLNASQLLYLVFS